MSPAPLLRLNAAADLRREPISAQDFCVVVDDFLAEPERLVQYACEHSADFSNPNIGYPGIQLRLHDDAVAEIYRLVRTRLSKLYGFMRARIGIRTLLSLVTWPPERLSAMQRVCHIDPHAGSGREKYAALVYLFHDEHLGGTSFYRWRNEDRLWEGFSLLRSDPPAGRTLLEQHFETFRGAPRYITESNDVAELLFTVPPRFNRFVFYSGDLPHSASITAPERLSPDPAKGRLTLNLFFSVLPKGGSAVAAQRL